MFYLSVDMERFSYKLIKELKFQRRFELCLKLG